MKKAMVLASIFAVLFTSSAYATNTGTTLGHSHSIPNSAFVDTDTDTDTNTQRQAWGAGVGADLVVYRGMGYLDQVKIENRYDVQNREYRGFVVGQIDLTKLWS